MSTFVTDENTLLDMVKTESRPCSGGWPVLVVHTLEVNDDKIVGSYYSGPGSPMPLPSLGVVRSGLYFILLNEDEIVPRMMKDQLVQKYIEFLETPELFRFVHT